MAGESYKKWPLEPSYFDSVHWVEVHSVEPPHITEPKQSFIGGTYAT